MQTLGWIERISDALEDAYVQSDIVTQLLYEFSDPGDEQPETDLQTNSARRLNKNVMGRYNMATRDLSSLLAEQLN